MVKEFYQRLLMAFLLLVLVVIGIIFVWQNNRIEANQLKVQKASRIEDLRGTQTNGNPVDASLWSQSAFSGLLEPDFTPWYPSKPNEGGTLKLLIGSDPKGFNYLIENSVDVSNIQALNMTPLVTRHKNEVTKYAPSLATYLGRSDDYLVYSYRIRPDIFWHKPALEEDETRPWLIDGTSCKAVGSRTAALLKKTQPQFKNVALSADRHWINGRCRVTAHDVIFWMKMMLNPQVGKAASARSYFSDLDISGVMATGDFSLKIKFKNKKYKNDLISKWLSTVPEFLYAYDADGTRFDDEVIGTKFEEHWYNPRGVGNGPYRFVNFERGVAVQLERDPWFPLGGNAADRIEIKVVKDNSQHPRMLLKSASAVGKSQNEGVHVTSLGSQQYRQVLGDKDKNSPFRNGSIKHDFFWTYGYGYIGWNADKAFFSDKRVRWAMSYALKTDEILSEIRFNLGKRTTGPITPGLPHYDDTLKPIPFDLKKAAALLDEAGWTDSDNDGILDKTINGRKTPFEFTFNIVAKPTHRMTAEILKESLKKIGVKCNLKAMEWANFLKELQTKQFDAVMLGWGTSPNVDFDQIWHSRHADEPQSSNYVGFRNKKADEIIEAMEFEFDMDKRYALSKAFHKLIYEEQPYTFLFQSKVPYFWTPQLQNPMAVGKVRPYLNPRAWYLNGE
ncbi:MAG: hypothetical protein CMH52_12545 [Myxococcales bacterium]|nr:hypothetical protein [Myxococcales bacterium]